MRVFAPRLRVSFSSEETTPRMSSPLREALLRATMPEWSRESLTGRWGSRPTVEKQEGASRRATGKGRPAIQGTCITGRQGTTRGIKGRRGRTKAEDLKDRRKACLLLCVEKYLTKNIKKLLTNDLMVGILNLTVNIKSLTNNVEPELTL